MQKAIYSVFTIDLALYFCVYEIYQLDFSINAGACISVLAEVFFVISSNFKKYYKGNFKMLWCLRCCVIQKEH